MLKRLFIFIAALLFPVILPALVHESLPSWHWANGCIEELRLRGGFTELFELNRPYTRGQIAEALVALRKREMEGTLHLTSSGKQMFLILVKEFLSEIEEIQGKSDRTDTVLLGIHGQGDVNGQGNGDAQYRGRYRSRIAVPLGQFGAAANAVNMDQYLRDDPTYVGKKWRGIVGYTEQAYVQIQTGRFRFKVGRDFMQWGAGQSGTFVFSDVCRPLDHVLASADLGPLRYTFVTAALDKMEPPSTGGDSLGFLQIGRIYRYLSAHRLDIKLMQGRFQAGISELVLYGGLNRQFDWFYLNPAIFFHGEQMNQAEEGNTLGSLDILVYPVPRWQIYGSLLIDDVQIERTGSGDQEPSEYGWLVGSRLADPANVPGLTLFGEYVRVSNRTYKTPRFWETFIHRNVPIGYPLGNDFDRMQIGLSQWIHGNVRFRLTYDQIRNGEGSLFTPFDTPWIGVPKGQGYDEPFPTGTVEKQGQVTIGVRCVLDPHIGFEAEWASSKWENMGHVKNMKRTESSWRIGLWVDGSWTVKLMENDQ
ncbi:MAG TPA: capsule assembly Wzi family protein [bacterium]